MSQSMPRATLLTLIVFGLCCGIGTAFAQTVPPANAAAATTVQVRYADARLRLARVDLETALRMNQMARESVSERELRRLRSNIGIAEQQLEIAKEYTHGSAKPTQLTAAEAAAKITNRDYRAALKVNKGTPGTVSDVLIKRLKIKAEMADIRVELWKDPAYLPSIVDEMQWQIDRLTEQVIELTQRVDATKGS